ncbi:dimethyladenosine transferase [Paenibacillus thiaminolyticus]|uniref:dimethyladenosine transferase n=1 Tax=Paenibacillus thiaminolyticus TaxID=49283 RepID=UPI002543F979|nr:dimethyladenosine transferase [Paenibacillus thiaminolyticus]WII38777.1 dimethyladenosine transferase [Paenibacillus thiaminolyticus]
MQTITNREQSQELSTDIHVITAEINAYQKIAGEAIFEIGRRLKHIRETIFTERGHLSGE